MLLPPPSTDADYTRVRQHDIEELWDLSIAPHVATSYQARQVLMHDLAESVLPSLSEILDVGCAQGTFGLRMAERGHRVVLLDARAGHIDYARRRHENGQVEFRVGFVEEQRDLAGRFDLVVLSDYLVADPRVLRDLHDAKVPHLPVRVRDGTGLVGPLVIPGMTSCLRCADLHRSDRDAAWPALAAQLRDAVGSADRATMLATAALALSQVDRVINAIRDAGDPRSAGDPPATLDTTLEVDVRTGSTASRRWSRHPRCQC